MGTFKHRFIPTKMKGGKNKPDCLAKMNPHKKMITDETSGILVENQRYLDYQGGYKQHKKELEKTLTFIADVCLEHHKAGIREVVETARKRYYNKKLGWSTGVFAYLQLMESKLDEK